MEGWGQKVTLDKEGGMGLIGSNFVLTWLDDDMMKTQATKYLKAKATMFLAIPLEIQMAEALPTGLIYVENFISIKQKHP